MLRVLCVTLLVSTALLAVAAQNSLTVTTDKGQVKGYTSNNVDKWRGIPYAAPPVGDLRFAVTQPAEAWSGVKDTTLAGPICPQLYGIIPGMWSGEEDCLTANIYAPSGRNLSEPLPVFVWIYGGGWDFGDGIEFGLYNADHLAELHNIVVVTFNYRLGPLGFLALEAFKNDNAAGSVGNYGIYDQVALLEWVQRNIGAFGGDATQVTIAGESAGAFSTCIHLASPLSKGLFRSAILESGTCSSEIFFQSQDVAFAWGETFANITGCPVGGNSDAEVLKCIRGLDLAAVMGPPSLNYSFTGYFPLMFPALSWGSTIDGVLLKDLPFNVIANGEFNEVTSVVMGSNKDEGTIFVPRLEKVVPGVHYPLENGDLDLVLNHFFGSNATVNAMVNAMYPLSSFPNVTVQAEVLLRDYFFLCPTSRAMLAMSTFDVPTFVYQFVYALDWPEYPTMGDYHSSELEFVFDNAWPPIIHAFSARDQTMADTFQYYWSNMIKYGNPNGPAGSNPPTGQIAWPTYDFQQLQSLALDVPARVVERLQEAQCEMWDTIKQWTPPTNKALLRQAGIELIAPRRPRVATE